jgi:hypothetical protein
MHFHQVPEHCRTLTEEEVTKNIFELTFAFDEVVQMGYREKITLPQVFLRSADGRSPDF